MRDHERLGNKHLLDIANSLKYRVITYHIVTIETTSRHSRVVRQPLSYYTTPDRRGFKRRVSVVLSSNLIRYNVSTIKARRLRRVSRFVTTTGTQPMRLQKSCRFTFAITVVCTKQYTCYEIKCYCKIIRSNVNEQRISRQKIPTT